MNNYNFNTACIIDDDEIYLFGAKRMIERYGLCNNVIQFQNGFDAIEFIRCAADNPDMLPDIILLDINMPVMNGWEFMEIFSILKKAKEIPVYMVSSSIDEADMQRARSISDIADYIIKPINKETLFEIFKKAEVC